MIKKTSHAIQSWSRCVRLNLNIDRGKKPKHEFIVVLASLPCIAESLKYHILNLLFPTLQRTSEITTYKQIRWNNTINEHKTFSHPCILPITNKAIN